MSSANNPSTPGAPVSRRYVGSVVAVLNVVLLSAIFLLYALYTNAYNDRLKEENLANISNLNQSAAINVASLLDSWSLTLEDIAQYSSSQNMTPDDLLEMLDQSNSNPDRYYELIGADGRGHLARMDESGSFPALDYTHTSYSLLQRIFLQASDNPSAGTGYAPEFTDGGAAAEKFFAVYRHLMLTGEDGGKEPYTLLLAARAGDVLALLNNQSNYTGQSAVLVDADGNYIVSSRDFKSSNFFQYLYVYNDLSLDQKNAIRQEMTDLGAGELYYQDAGGAEDCVFRYQRMEQDGWYCITCVPLSSFHEPVFNRGLIILLITLMLALLAVDTSWLTYMNRRLRISILREKEANTAKGNFMSRMSHEIRTPLNAIIGYNTISRNEMLAARSDDEQRQSKMKVMDCLEKSEIASKHLLTIINDVLDMAAIESGRIHVAHDRFDFRGLITSLTTVFYSQAKAKGVELDVVISDLTEEWFVGDQMRTNQILTNLLSNAIKFTPEGGLVTLRIHQPEADTNASHMHFEVTDTGIGMTQEYLSHIWTPFEQADSSISRRFGGTGLGLSIVKSLVDLMGGAISVRSEPGKGTTFDVDLTFQRTELPEYSRIDFNTVNALVVDDDINTCNYICLLFHRCGAKCTPVTSGADAVVAFSDALRRGEPYTVCLVDWQMPQMDGIETVHRLREITDKDLPIIVLTAYDYSELADKAAEAGVNRFITKPLFQSSLFDLLVNISGTPAPKPVKKSKEYDFAGARVLLAEDNAMNMEIAKTIMESAGLLVDSAWNGREAVDQFLSSKEGTYLAILMDVHMPEMSGHEATRVIRASSHPEASTIPIIAMTADAFAENVAEAQASGMTAHIAKPIDINILFETLMRCIK